MNKQEAIRRMKREQFQVPYGPGIFVHAVFADKAIDLISQIHEPQKVVVPKFVATWIEHCKQSNLDLDNAMRYTRVNNAETGVEEWIYENQDLFARAWLFGFEIEQEKLYTVEIPNPESVYPMILYKNDGGRVILGTCHTPENWKKLERNQLTESEIKQDFDWAWQFAKEVE